MNKYIKCKYCSYKCLRPVGKGKVNYKKLTIHVVNNHKEQLEQALQVEDIYDYMQEIEIEEDRELASFYTMRG